MFNFYFFVVDVDYFSMFESKGKIILMLVGKLVSNCNSVRIVLEAQILPALRSVCTRLMRAELVTILKKKSDFSVSERTNSLFACSVFKYLARNSPNIRNTHFR
jgi:hypothetical protein